MKHYCITLRTGGRFNRKYRYLTLEEMELDLPYFRSKYPAAWIHITEEVQDV